MGFFQRISIKRFNRVCIIAAALWLIVTIPLGILFRPTIPDFEQFYMSGVVVSRGEWSALYPEPLPGSLDNPGLRIHSRAKPLWRSLSKELKVWDHTHFMLPPPAALLFVPFSYLSYQKALWAWIFIEIACVLGVAVIAGRLLRQITAQPTWLEGLAAILIAASPMTARAIRIANLSPPVALMLGVALLAIVRQSQPARGAAALLFGAVLKYATLILSPLLLAMRQWRMLLYLALFGVLVLLFTISVSGIEPFIEFYTVILPTLSRPSAFLGNQTLPGMLARVFGRPLPPEIALGLNLARVFSLGLVLTVLFTRRQEHWKNPVNVMAAAGLLISWLLIFSPIAWEHWPVFLCPLWGWLLWEACQKGWRAVFVAASLLLMYSPAGIFQVRGFAWYRFKIPEPYNSTQLAGVALFGGLALWRLMRRLSVESVKVPLAAPMQPLAAGLPRDTQRPD